MRRALPIGNARWQGSRVPRQALVRAIAAAREELLLMLALWFAALAVSRSPMMASPDRTVWQVALLIQSMRYAATVAVSIVSALQLPAGLIGIAGANRRRGARVELPARPAIVPAQTASGTFKPVYRAPLDDY